MRQAQLKDFDVTKWSELVNFEPAGGLPQIGKEESGGAKSWSHALKMRKAELGEFNVKSYHDIVNFSPSGGLPQIGKEEEGGGKSWSHALRMRKATLEEFNVKSYSDIVNFDAAFGSTGYGGAPRFERIPLDFSDVVELEPLTVDLADLVNFDSTGLADKITEAVQEAIDDRQLETTEDSWAKSHVTSAGGWR